MDKNIEVQLPDSKLAVEYSYSNTKHGVTEKKKAFFQNKDQFLNWLAEQRQFIRESCNDYAMTYCVSNCNSSRVLYSKTI